MNSPITIVSLSMTVATLVLAAVILQFTAVAMAGALFKKKLPPKRVPPVDKRLLYSSAALALVAIAVFGRSAAPAPAAQNAAAVLTTPARGSCSSIETGTAAEAVQSRLGKADEIRSEEETRGPGAKTWIYRQSRCAIHILDDTVEFID